MPNYKYTMTEQITASIEVTVEADNEEEAMEMAREKAFAIPLHREEWQSESEIIEEDIEEVKQGGGEWQDTLSK